MPEADKRSLARDIVDVVVARYEASQGATNESEPAIRVVRD
jgi:hypothetical protein